MIQRAFILFSIASAIVLLFAARASMARTASDAPLAMASQFDLSKHRKPDDQRQFRVATLQSPFQPDDAAPHWSYSPLDGGPTLEVAALGGGSKDAPGLAHVRVDWAF